MVTFPYRFSRNFLVASLPDRYSSLNFFKPSVIVFNGFIYIEILQECLFKEMESKACHVLSLFCNKFDKFNCHRNYLLNFIRHTDDRYPPITIAQPEPMAQVS